MKAIAVSVPDRIMKRARANGRGGVFKPRDFLGVAGCAAVDQALSRLVKGPTSKLRFYAASVDSRHRSAPGRRERPGWDRTSTVRAVFKAGSWS